MLNTRVVLEKCLNYIENNIKSKITLDEISKYSGISKFHMHRMFKSLTGSSIMDYVLSRKLTESLEELLNKDMRIIDIALEYSFGYEQSYIRAFKKKFGCTPIKAKRPLTSFKIKEKINIDDMFSFENALIYKPFFVFKQDFYIVGIENEIYTRYGNDNANVLAKDFFFNKRKFIKNPVNPNVYIGYVDWSKNVKNRQNYIPSLEVKNLENIPNGMSGRVIPSNKYIVFRFVGFFSAEKLKGHQLGRLLVTLYRKWIKNSKFKSAADFRFEYVDMSISNENYCEIDIYQPIQRIN
jgi:AraC family transcriptional regulator